MRLLALVVLALVAAAPSPALASPPPADAAADPWTSTGAAPRMDGRPLLRRAAPSESAGASERTAATRTAAGDWLRTTLALGGVVALIVLLSWGYRALSGAGGRLPFAFRGRSPAALELVGRMSLSPRQTLCLVRVGPRLVLLGATPTAIHALDVIGDADVAASVTGQARRAGGAAAEFERLLRDEREPYEPTEADAAAPGDTPADADAKGASAGLAGLRERFGALIAQVRRTHAGR